MTEEKVQSPPSRFIRIVPRDRKVHMEYLLPLFMAAGLAITHAWTSFVWSGVFAVVVIICVTRIKVRRRMQSPLWLSEEVMNIFGEDSRWEDVIEFYLQVDEDIPGRPVEGLVVVTITRVPHFKRFREIKNEYFFRLDELQVARKDLVAWIHFYRVHLRHGWKPHHHFSVPRFPDHSDFFQ